MRAAACAALVWCCASARLAAAAADDSRRAETRPLVLLVQGDAIVASAPAAPGDPPEGAALRLRRVQVGADGRSARLHGRGVLEAQDADASGNHFAPVAGGRLAGPLRVTEAFLSWTPHVAIHVDAGALRVPFSLTRQIDDANLRMPERAAFTRTMAPDFRVGAGVGGDFGAMSYAAAVMSSSRWIDGDLFDRGAMVAFRVAAEPIGPVGLTPWRRPLDDPWTDWFRFSHAVSFLYGTLFEPRSIGAGTDAAIQWRRLVATGEYIFLHAPSGDQQGAVVEPGVTLGARRLDIVARGSWQRAAGGNGWGGGAALTLYANDPRARLQAGFERRTGPDPLGAASYALLRLTLTID
jgi:phosphate-selective porin O/P